MAFGYEAEEQMQCSSSDGCLSLIYWVRVSRLADAMHKISMRNEQWNQVGVGLGWGKSWVQFTRVVLKSEPTLRSLWAHFLCCWLQLWLNMRYIMNGNQTSSAVIANDKPSHNSMSTSFPILIRFYFKLVLKRFGKIRYREMREK